jgi:hypothetical protein
MAMQASAFSARRNGIVAEGASLRGAKRRSNPALWFASWIASLRSQ